MPSYRLDYPTPRVRTREALFLFSQYYSRIIFTITEHLQTIIVLFNGLHYPL